MPLACLALASAVALADRPEPIDLDPAYEKGQRLAKAGAITGAAGLVAFGGTAAVMLANRPLSEGTAQLGTYTLLLEMAAVEVGPPLMAAGSLRAARELQSHDLSVSRGLGYATWGLWGGQLLLGSALSGEQVDTRVSGAIAGAMLLGSYGAGLGQMAVNNRVRSGIRVSSEAAPPVRVAWVPDPDGGGQLVVAGEF